MTAPLTFMMGKYAAVLPTDRRYARNHMWASAAGDRLRFGFSSYAVRLMQDVYFLDWQVNAGDAVELKQRVGNIETSKAVSDLFAPVAGTMEEFNQQLLQDPSAINTDNHGAGWLFAMTSAGEGLLTAQEYYAFLDEGWEKTQNMLKGHM